MTIQQAKEFFRESLIFTYLHNEILALERIVFEELMGATPAELVIKKDQEIDAHLQDKIKEVTSKLKDEIPIQYIFGYTEFYDLKLNVNENVLIPRQETEELVDWVIKENNSNTELKILDIGTGSGCIILSLAQKFNNCQCYAIDISENALEVARQNAVLNNLEVFFSIHDILKVEENPFQEKYDIIVSNPPYVLESEKTQMKKNVLDYEPELALFVDDNDALIYYHAIASKAKKWLKPNGKLYFEINEQKGEGMHKLLGLLDYKDIEVRKDLNSKDRMVRGVFR